MHKAIIAKINVAPHPDPDVHSLAVGTVCNETVICGKFIPDGMLGIYFPCELQLSEVFATKNDLIRRKDDDGKPAGGMFDPNRRVRVQKFKGVQSHGFWCELSFLTKIGIDISTLKEGDMLDEWRGIPICNKYFTPAHVNNKSKSKNNKESKKPICIFPEHVDTEQFKHFAHTIKKGDKLVISLKVHGSSQRVARNYEIRKPNWAERLVGMFFPIDLTRMTTLNGTRRVTLNYKDPTTKGYYSDSFRQKVADKIAPYLEDHMQIYFEVVGYEGQTPIMHAHTTDKTSDKDIKKTYKNPIIYSYGCKPGEFEIYVYRIAYVLPNKVTIDLPWENVKKWCVNNKIKHVPEITSFTFDGNHRDLTDLVESLAEGRDPIDPSHPKEGVCIRVDGIHWKCFKQKSFTFKLLEGIIKDNPEFIDTEEAS